MTRNNEISQIRDVVTGPPKASQTEAYQLAAWAQRYRAVKDGGPLAWARSIHTMHTAGEMRPRKEPCDAAKIGKGLPPHLQAAAHATVARGENELRLRSMIRASRMLSASADPKDSKMASELGKFLELSWGLKRAYETISEGDADLYDQLRDAWGEVQLPPPDATVNLYAADELLIAAAVRRLG